MNFIDSYDYVFPVCGLKDVTAQNSEPRSTLGRVYGTAWYIGENRFITAGHSLKNAQSEHECVGLGFIDNKTWWSGICREVEIIDNLDLGIVDTRVPNAKALPWRLDALAMLAEIQTVGFPFAMDYERMAMNVRAFKGHVVSSQVWSKLPSQPKVYELSFQCPCELSGAPLFTPGLPNIVGLVIGNTSTEMNVFTDREVLDNGTRQIVERYEALQLGIGIQASYMVDAYSESLSGTLRDHLTKQNLITKT